MPIKRLQEDRRPAFPQLGELRKGGPKPERGIGKDLKYFRFTAQPGEAEVAKRFHEVYGSEPTEIDCWLPYPGTDECFEAWLEEWVAGGLVHRCDGDTMVLVRTKDGRIHQTEQPCPDRELPPREKRCRQVARLKLVIPALGRLGYVTALTTSVYDIIHLTEQLRAVEGAAQFIGGDLRGIPFLLKRSPRRVSTPGENGKPARREKWLLSIEAHPDWAAELIKRVQRVALAPSAERLALEAPVSAVEPADETQDDEIGGWTEVADEAEPEIGSPPTEDFGPAPEPEPEDSAPEDLDELAEWIGRLRMRVTEVDSPRAMESASDKQLNWCKGLIDKTVGRGLRNALAKALFGIGSFDQLSVAQASVLIDAAMERHGDTWQERPEFAARAKRLCVRASGQKEMPV